MSQGDQARYRIGDQMFNDLPALLNFYKVFQTIHIRCLPCGKFYNFRVSASLFVYFRQFLGSLSRHNAIDSAGTKENRKSSCKI